MSFTEDGEKIIRETIAHELCHTLSGYMNHGRTFHDKAAKIMNLMGYHIDTKADIDSRNGKTHVFMFVDNSEKIVEQFSLFLNEINKEKKEVKGFALIKSVEEKTPDYIKNRVLLNLDNPSADLKLAEPSELIDYSINENFNDFLDQAFKTRADLQALENRIRQSYEEVTLRKKDNMPTVRLNANASANDQLHGRDTKTYTGSIGISLNVPLYTGFSNTYKINKAKHDLERNKAEYEMLKQQIGQELWATFQKYMTAKKSYEKSLILLRSIILE